MIRKSRSAKTPQTGFSDSAKSSARKTLRHPLALGSFRNWLKVLWANGGVDRAFLGRAAFVSSVSLLTSPFRMWERFELQLRKLKTVVEPPIFIVGHWRSGTTLLHQLLCRDPAFGYVSTFQSIAPEWFLIGSKTIKGLVSKAVPATRMMDDMPLSLDGPQEEEFALAETSPYSFYHQWSFPRKAREHFDKYVLFDNVSAKVAASWKRAYLNVLSKATFHAGEKRLVIKNPVNTARIGALLELFPNAKFVHIYRNPYVVFLSTLRFFERVLDFTQLQRTGREQIEANVLWFYEQIMRRFIADKDLIPAENLTEIRFEDFEADPIAHLRRVYEQLDLPGFERAEPGFRDHLASVDGYRKNEYSFTADAIEKVDRHWGFAVERWGYEAPTV